MKIEIHQKAINEKSTQKLMSERNIYQRQR